MGIQLVIDCLLNRGSSPDSETIFFKTLKHEDLVNYLITYLNSHRHFLGYCHLELAQALNDRGVDLFLLTDDERIGFQIKSDFDVSDDKFAANVKRQFAEALSYSLTHYFILICASMEEHKLRISHLMNEIALFKKVDFSIYSPNNLVIPLRNKPTVPRDELLLRRVITDDALHDYERGYEHLPEVMDADIESAMNQFYKFGDDWFESKEGVNAYNKFTAIVHQKQRKQFEADFYPTLSKEIKQKRKSLINSAFKLLDKCRACTSWDDKSEDKLASWIEYIPEEMIPCTSIPNLLLINKRLKEYYEIHIEMETES